MTLTELMQKPSVVEFEDKYTIINPLSLEEEPDNETIRCKIPELNLGEGILLNAWGSWEVHHYDDHRRRLGIYTVVSKEDEENPHYILREEKRFSESELVHISLSGNFASITEDIKGLRYIALDWYGRPLSLVGQ